MRQAIQERLLQPRNRGYKWIPFEPQEKIIKEIFATMDDQKEHDCETVIMLSGPRGMGKSMIGRELAHRGHERFISATPPRDIVLQPVLRALLGSGSGFTNVAVDIRHFQGLPIPTSHYRSAHTRVAETCGQQQTRCIFIDRFETILDQGPVTQRDAFKAIGYLASATKVPIVLCGTFDPNKVFTATNDTHGFIADRAMYLELPRWDCDINFLSTIRTLARLFDVPEPDALVEETVAKRLHELSNGITRKLVRGLYRSLRKAAEDGVNSLSIDHIEKGFEVYRPANNKENVSK